MVTWYTCLHIHAYTLMSVCLYVLVRLQTVGREMHPQLSVELFARASEVVHVFMLAMNINLGLTGKRLAAGPYRGIGFLYLVM